MPVKGFRLSPYRILTDCSVDSTILQDSAVSNAGLQDCAVDSGKIADSAVSYQNIQSVTAARLLGRYDAANGVTQEIALGTNLSFDSDAGELDAAGAALGDCSVTTAKLADSAVTTIKMSDTAVTTAKINDAAVTNAKLGDTSVTTGKINDDAVTYAKIQNVTASRLLGRHDTTSGVVEEIQVLGGLSFDTTNDALTSDSVAQASLTTAGRSEHATPTEINTASDTQRVLTPNELRQSNYGTRLIEVIVTDTTVATGDGKARFNVPAEMDSWDLVDADACVDTNTSATVGPTIQIRNATDAADMLSTKITIDTSEVTSYTATTAPVIDTANDSVVTGNRIEIDVDSAGTAAGLRVLLSFRKY